MRWRRVRCGERGGVVSTSCGKVKEVGRRDRQGGEWSSAEEVRYVGSNGVGEVSSSDLVQVRVRVRVRGRERMGGSLARQREGQSEWV